MIEDWAVKTKDGSLADLPRQPAWQVWDKVCAGAGELPSAGGAAIMMGAFTRPRGGGSPTGRF